MPYQSPLERILFESDQMERRAMFFRDAALFNAMLGAKDKAAEMWKLYTEHYFPELAGYIAKKDALAEEILKKLPTHIPVFPSGGVSFDQHDVLRQNKVDGAGLNDPVPTHRLELKK